MFLSAERLATWLWLLCLATILYAGLWPLDFHPRNDVTWLKSENGIDFVGRGIVYSKVPFAEIINSSTAGAHGFTLEFLLRPAVETYPHLAVIASDNSSEANPGFIVAQYRTILLLLATYRNGNHLISRKLGVDQTLIPNRLVDVAVTSGPAGTAIYVNGKKAETYPNPVATEVLKGPLIIGNSSTTAYPWLGNVLELAAYDNQRDESQISSDSQAWLLPRPNPGDAVALYDFSERSGETANNRVKGAAALYVPQDLVPLKRTILSWDFRFNRSGLEDVCLNIAGFIPFGFLSAIVLARRVQRRHAIMLTIVMGFVLSLGIEITQSYLPLRFSSSIDLLTNTTGTVVGVAIFAFWLAQRRPEPSSMVEP